MAVKTKLLSRVHWAFAAAWYAIVVPVVAQPSTPAPQHEPLAYSSSSTTGIAFRIGCLRSDPDTRISVELIQQLADYLRKQDRVRHAMEQEGVSEIQVQSFDAHRWLMEAMDAEQVDLSFCSSVDYVYQRGTYAPIFQLRLPHDQPGRDKLLYRGSIFVGSQSSAFKLPEKEIQSHLSQLLTRSDVALVGPSSAAGYIYPLLRLHELTSGSKVVPRTQFWGSSEEVVKAVINGSADIGACDSGVIGEVLRANNLDELRPKLIREIAKTNPLPRDPVVLLSRWSPRSSAFGRTIRDFTRQFFSELRPPLPSVQPSAEERQFNQLREDIDRFNQLRSATDSATKAP